MRIFQVVLTLEVQADIKRLDATLQTRLLNKLEWIGQNAELLHHQALKGTAWDGCFKYHVGDYHIIYHIDQPSTKLTILKVEHRREVYK